MVLHCYILAINSQFAHVCLSALPRTISRQRPSCYHALSFTVTPRKVSKQVAAILLQLRYKQPQPLQIFTKPLLWKRHNLLVNNATFSVNHSILYARDTLNCEGMSPRRVLWEMLSSEKRAATPGYSLRAVHKYIYV